MTNENSSMTLYATTGPQMTVSGIPRNVVAGMSVPFAVG